MKKLVLLGATGSIGTQTIDIVLKYPDMYEIIALSVGYNIDLLEEILKKIKVRFVCTAEQNKYLIDKYPDIVFYMGDMGLNILASLDNYDLLVNALVGFVGLKPTLTAIDHKKDVALANKETLVVAGKFINKEKRRNNVNIFPIDSEHSAIFQALQGNRPEDVKRLIITASGGSFREKNREELKQVTVKDALKHPNWTMGAKITIDSATMMNKGFEVIEAHWLFDIDYDNIDVIMHKQSIIHSMVEYVDNSVIAQLGNADMRLPIQYALCYPNRYEIKGTKALDFNKISHLSFEEVNLNRFPLLKLAYEVGRKDGNLPSVLNASNEVANQAFRDEKISFLEIESLVISAVTNAKYIANATLEEIIYSDGWARKYVNDKINKMSV
jgi:1-deoxy-D-xylulose-5-phosphate reductoisomerase